MVEFRVPLECVSERFVLEVGTVSHRMDFASNRQAYLTVRTGLDYKGERLKR